MMGIAVLMGVPILSKILPTPPTRGYHIRMTTQNSCAGLEN